MAGPFLNVVDRNGRRIPRAAIQAQANYEGATTGRRLGVWGLSSAGPNTTTSGSLVGLRSRSHEFVRNQPWAKGAVDAFVSEMIGTGITPEFNTPDKAINDQLKELYNESSSEWDYDGVNSAAGLQALKARTFFEGGEAFVRRYARPQSERLAVPIQFQVLEGEQLDPNFSQDMPGSKIRMGVEFRRNRRVKYWFYREHPGENVFFNSAGDRVGVLAKNIFPVYLTERPGQIRGLPRLAPVILTLHEMDQTNDAELVRRKTTAMFGGFINKPPLDPEDLDSDIEAANNPLGPASSRPTAPLGEVTLEPGTFPQLPDGYSVTFAQPHDVGGSYIEKMKMDLHEVARGTGLPYEVFTGDLSQVNFSSIRAGLLVFRRLVMQLACNVIIHQGCRPQINAWITSAVLNNRIDLPVVKFFENYRKYTRVNWITDGWDWTDPVKDVLADIMAVRAGFTSRRRVVIKRGDGFTAEDIDHENTEDNRRADATGLIYDSDARKTTGSGVYQAAAEAAKTEDGNATPSK